MIWWKSWHANSIDMSARILWLSQQIYVEKMLDKFDMGSLKAMNVSIHESL